LKGFWLFLRVFVSVDVVVMCLFLLLFTLSFSLDNKTLRLFVQFILKDELKYLKFFIMTGIAVNFIIFSHYYK